MTITESIETQVLKTLPQPKAQKYSRGNSGYTLRGSHRNIVKSKLTVRVLDSGNWEFIQNDE